MATNKNRLLLAGLFVILVAIIVDYLDKTIIPNLITKIEVKKIQSELIEKEQYCLDILNSIQKDPEKEFIAHYNALIEQGSKKRVLFYLYKDNQPLYWTSNKAIPDLTRPQANESFLTLLENGYYIQLQKAINEYKVFALIMVKRNYPFENQYLKNHFLLVNENENIRLLELPEEDNPNVFKIKNIKGTYLFSVFNNIRYPLKGVILLLYLMGGLLLFVFINGQINYFLQHKNYYRGGIIYLATLIASVIGWKVFKVPQILFNHDLFSPEIYASSSFFPSIGDLLTTIILVSWTIILVTKHFCFKLPAKFYLRLAASFLFFSAFLICVHFISESIASLVTNSSIPLNMNEFSKFNYFTFTVFLIILIIMYSLVRTAYYFHCIIGSTRMKLYIWFIIMGIPSLIYYLVLMHNEHLCFLNIPLSLTIWALIFFFPSMTKGSMNSIILITMICASFVAHQIKKSNEFKEIENRKHLINIIASGRDALTEELIIEEVNKIKNDNYLKNYFTNPLISKAALTNRFNQIYFSGYFSTFDIKYNTYLANKQPFKSGTSLPFNDFLDLINNSQVIDLQNQLYFINSFDGSPFYVSFIDICHDTSSQGILIIEVRKKPFLEQSVYPELIIDRNVTRSEEMKKYSYAIYLNNNLINQSGEFTYPLILGSERNKAKPFYQYHDEGYSHLIYKQNKQFMVVMSIAKEKMFTSLALFSFMFIFAVLLIALSQYFIKLFYYIDSYGILSPDLRKNLNPFLNLSFKFKIQLTIMISIFIALIITGFFTIRFIKINSEQKTRNQLQRELRVVAENTLSYFDENSANSDEFISSIRNTANLYRIDINLFDRKGELIISSQPIIYDRNIISRLIDGKAYYHLHFLHESNCIHYERIGGKIKYLSAYTSIRDESDHIIAYINLPYYSKQKETKDEITSLIVTIVNLYVFLFLLILVSSYTIVSTFTEPLELIKKHLGFLQLGKPNVKIKWEGKDEISSLIQEYNSMLDKVEKSAEALAQTERELAWREMAKQVAHEIKNPLTPMKLSLQQLLRAWNDKSADMDSRLKKTVEILISRIETLSKIATEFSEFARMPEAELEICLIEDVLIDTVEFFDSTRSISLNLNTSGTYILADKDQLSRAMNNLIKNALQSIPQGREPRIEISSRLENESHVIVSISDNGVGIPDNLKDKIFLPNFSTKSSGMGLGLAIVSRIVKSAKGNIWFETEISKGSTFHISFPVYTAENDIKKA